MLIESKMEAKQLLRNTQIVGKLMKKLCINKGFLGTESLIHNPLNLI